MYDQETILKEIRTKWAGKTVHFAKETDSTNEWAKRLSQEGAPHGTLAVAEFQSAGKGRLGRRWQAPEGSSVMMSLLLKPEFEPGTLNADCSDGAERSSGNAENRNRGFD